MLSIVIFLQMSNLLFQVLFFTRPSNFLSLQFFFQLSKSKAENVLNYFIRNIIWNDFPAKKLNIFSTKKEKPKTLEIREFFNWYRMLWSFWFWSRNSKFWKCLGWHIKFISNTKYSSTTAIKNRVSFDSSHPLYQSPIFSITCTP